MLSARYKRVLSSDRWRRLKSRLMEKRGSRCESCGAVGVPLDLHHKHYETLGRERHCDVSLLCRGGCHPRHDRMRRQQKAIERAAHAVDMSPIDYMEAFGGR